MNDESEDLKTKLRALEKRLAILECGKASLSPNIINGLYHCDRDPGNWILWGEDVLTILEAKCLDNGEGTAWPHGPYGHVYLDLFEVPNDLDSIPDGADQRRIGPSMRLRGPWRTHDGLDGGSTVIRSPTSKGEYSAGVTPMRSSCAFMKAIRVRMAPLAAATMSSDLRKSRDLKR